MNVVVVGVCCLIDDLLLLEGLDAVAKLLCEFLDFVAVDAGALNEVVYFGGV